MRSLEPFANLPILRLEGGVRLQSFLKWFRIGLQCIGIKPLISVRLTAFRKSRRLFNASLFHWQALSVSYGRGAPTDDVFPKKNKLVLFCA